MGGERDRTVRVRTRRHPALVPEAPLYFHSPAVFPPTHHAERLRLRTSNPHLRPVRESVRRGPLWRVAEERALHPYRTARGPFLREACTPFAPEMLSALTAACLDPLHRCEHEVSAVTIVSDTSAGVAPGLSVIYPRLPAPQARRGALFSPARPRLAMSAPLRRDAIHTSLHAPTDRTLRPPARARSCKARATMLEKEPRAGAGC